MGSFKIKVREVLEGVFEVEASSAEEAVKLLEKEYGQNYFLESGSTESLEISVVK